MKIAVSTQDGKTVCGHLGKCRSFLVYEAEGGEVVSRSQVDIGGLCPGHARHGHEGGHAGHGGGHNVSPFEGCDAVITQGMGQGMLGALEGSGIQPVITGLSDPDEAVRLFIRGELGPSSVSNCGCKGH